MTTTEILYRTFASMIFISLPIIVPLGSQSPNLKLSKLENTLLGIGLTMFVGGMLGSVLTFIWTVKP